MSTISDHQIIATLQREGAAKTPVELAELLGELSGRIEQGLIVTMFKRAFPEIPLRTLLELGAWSRVSNGDITDEEFNRRLSPWIGPQSTVE